LWVELGKKLSEFSFVRLRNRDGEEVSCSFKPEDVLDANKLVL
jgi:hypothetical protein